jgi:glycosyltransferase involved in cell wall biosynthesis
MTLRVMQVVHQGGGAGSVTSTLHLSLGLQAAGLDVRLVCPPGSEVEALAWGGGLTVHPVDLVPGAHSANAAVLQALLHEHPVDLVNSQSARDRQALVRLARRGELGVPLVLTRRQIPRTFFVENWIASRAADRVVAVSEAVARALRRRGTPARKLAVIPNGLVAARVDAAVLPVELARWRDRIAWDTAHRTVGIIARPKDQDVVVRALDQVATPVRLVLAGVAPDHPIAARARAVAPRHAVVCLPFGPEIRPLYELLELVLLPSRMEGLSQSLLEAMALAKPVIASRAGGNVDLIRHEADGLLVAPRDPAEWARAIDGLLRDPARAAALGAEARRTARETFSLEHTVQRTLDLYRGLAPAGRL